MRREFSQNAFIIIAFARRFAYPVGIVGFNAVRVKPFRAGPDDSFMLFALIFHD